MVDDVLSLPHHGDDDDLLLNTLAEPAAMPRLGVSKPLMRSWMQSLMGGSWAQVQVPSMQVADHVIFSQHGTRPGDPTADLSLV